MEVTLLPTLFLITILLLTFLTLGNYPSPLGGQLHLANQLHDQNELMCVHKENNYTL